MDKFLKVHCHDLFEHFFIPSFRIQYSELSPGQRSSNLFTLSEPLHFFKTPSGVLATRQQVSTNNIVTQHFPGLYRLDSVLYLTSHSLIPWCPGQRSAWFLDAPDSAQLDSMMLRSSLSLIQWSTGQRSAWFYDATDSAHFDTMMLRTSLSLIQWSSGQRSAWFYDATDSAQFDSRMLRTSLSLIQCCPGQRSAFDRQSSVPLSSKLPAHYLISKHLVHIRVCGAIGPVKYLFNTGLQKTPLMSTATPHPAPPHSTPLFLLILEHPSVDTGSWNTQPHISEPAGTPPSRNYQEPLQPLLSRVQWFFDFLK